jgi:hypothetical protein
MIFNRKETSMKLNLRSLAIATSLTLASAFTFAQAPAAAVTAPAAAAAPAAKAAVTAATPAAPAAVAAPAAAPAATKAAAKASATPATAAPGGGAGKVWVNSGSKVYHCEGTKFYGKTKAGEYMTEAAAKAAGNHGIKGKDCAAAK